MGMYDTLNDEQVKCFPWYSFDVISLSPEGSIGGHGGKLKYYGNGSEIPYLSLAYNYGKNFIISRRSFVLVKSENGLHM